MSRLVTAAVVAALMLFAAVPAFAEQSDGAVMDGAEAEAPHAAEAVEAVEPAEVLGQDSGCDNPDELDVVTVEGLVSAIDTPDLTLVDREIKSFLIDLGSDSAAFELTADMAWDVPSNDFDLEISSEETTVVSDSAQPFDPSAESVTLPVTHCQVIDVAAYNFFALLPTPSLSLSFTVQEPVDDAADAADDAPAVASPLEALLAR